MPACTKRSDFIQAISEHGIIADDVRDKIGAFSIDVEEDNKGKIKCVLKFGNVESVIEDSKLEHMIQICFEIIEEKILSVALVILKEISDAEMVEVGTRTVIEFNHYSGPACIFMNEKMKFCLTMGEQSFTEDSLNLLIELGDL